MRKDSALYVILGMTFVGLLVDIRYEHHDVLNEFWEAWIPLVTTGVAMIATIMAMGRKPKLQIWASLLFVFVIFVGLVGIYEHTKLRGYMFTRYINGVKTGPDGKPLPGSERPTWAPMSFSLLGSIGFILVSTRFRFPPSGDPAKD